MGEGLCGGSMFGSERWGVNPMTAGNYFQGNSPLISLPHEKCLFVSTTLFLVTLIYWSIYTAVLTGELYKFVAKVRHLTDDCGISLGEERFSSSPSFLLSFPKTLLVSYSAGPSGE